ncbi:MAG: response regulator transcription factor [Cyclobacteriaceae bacterium]|nr:response regulator transcription factor [Cyclobacteriaceae bacterium]
MKFSLLIIEDEDSVRSGLRLLLESKYKNIQLAEAITGEEAVDKLELQRFNIIICDYKLPGLFGTDLIKKLLEKDPETKIIVFSRYSSQQYRNDCFDAGAFSFISKIFFDESTIFEAIEDAL